MCIKGKKACTCKVEGSKNVNLFKEEKSNINMAGHLILDSRTSDQLYSLHKKKKKNQLLLVGLSMKPMYKNGQKTAS